MRPLPPRAALSRRCEKNRDGLATVHQAGLLSLPWIASTPMARRRWRARPARSASSLPARPWGLKQAAACGSWAQKASRTSGPTSKARWLIAEGADAAAMNISIPVEKALDDTLKKQNPGPLEDKLENPEALAEAIAAVDVFNLGRTPSFEPRRAAGVPTALASETGLLFFPIRSGPETAIRDWFASLGDVTEGFEQKSLRQWKRRHPGHRSFTVLRHPLLRAHAAFRRKIVLGEAQDLRRILINGFLAELQPPGEPFASVQAERAAFLIFLNYCRLATGGQTGARVDPSLASQTALVQGFAGFQPLDHLLREDRLTEGLVALAAEVGAPPAAITPDPAEAALLSIWDETLEAAAAEAYARDYMGFGFTRWRK